MGKNNKNRGNKDKNANNSSSNALPKTLGQQSIVSSKPPVEEEPVINEKVSESIIAVVSMSELTTSNSLNSNSIDESVAVPVVTSDTEITVEHEEEVIVTASSTSQQDQNLIDMSFRSNISVTEIVFEKSPVANSTQVPVHGTEEEEDDYLPGVAAEEDDNILNLSSSVPLDASDMNANAPTAHVSSFVEEPDRHETDPMFVRPHGHSSQFHVNYNPESEETHGQSLVSSFTNYVNNKLLVFVDALDLTKSSDMADYFLEQYGIEHCLRRYVPLPLFLIELMIFFPRIQLVVLIFLMRVLYNLFCFTVRAHVFMACIPLQIIESLLTTLFQGVVSMAVAFLNQVPGGQKVPKGLNGHAGKNHH